MSYKNNYSFISSAPLPRSWVEIDGQALRFNIRVARNRIPKKTKIIAVVKSDAYGHGLVPISRELVQSGIEVLGINNVDEVIELRNAGIQNPLLILCPILPPEAPLVIANNAWVVVSSFNEAKWLNNAAEHLGKKAIIHLKIDTGMGRLGFSPSNFVKEMEKIKKLSSVCIGAVCTHFAQADTDLEATEKQWLELLKLKEYFKGLPIHVANSAALWRKSVYACDYVRIGLALYGLAPMSFLRRLLRPIMSWKCKVVLIKELPKNHPISYGSTYRLKKPSKIAVLSIGYGDGYLRSLSNKAFVLIKGKRCPVRGAVTMNQIMVDISELPSCKIGEEAILIGTQGKESINADELAKLAGTISYEILTNIHSNIPRQYRHFLSRSNASLHYYE
ncbi:alanine racemase [Candidatus Methylacidiphilum fumarolicum]|uniref:Alanine racemase n=2 Tax=Candidatus Methylacidiphilum fumarolicum TaxID=591154 RepID=I0K1J6_METFB|nr:alanine racemase [Candidatus Methylacidiphilum fumarolicum]MBW6415485.1 alanine racemase [Candidatus Methylacidiphilum fumarolicum]TFE68541.1 alanine racemase [Candidatus Methylacidiphilum fumarolicum]TFE73231.1 alanine racemase [Candidatus Methylacidiphilum fumarolicum]TFE73258.1 alanine racemase [Candidatus Methylacidiphilum fumarolicum]TFE76485.1 alanine racemase [Candidatus Methylacidiphilum fumarolicum]